MAIVEKSALLQPRIGEEKYTIPGVGDVIIRPLTRGQSMRVQQVEDMEERDNLIISMGLVNPPMTADEVQQWADAAPGGELARLGLRIAELSGMLDGQPKEVTKSTPRRGK